MEDDANLLDLLGITLVHPEQSPKTYAQVFRAARLIRESGRRIIGLLPAGPRVAVPPIALQLGVVLVDVCQGAIAFIDANTKHPCMRPLLEHAEGNTTSKGFATVWAGDMFVVLTPVASTTQGLDLGLLETTLRSDIEGYAHVLVDMTGMRSVGEHWLGFELVDGVLTVGKARVTTESELLDHHREVPVSRDMGVLLVSS